MTEAEKLTKDFINNIDKAIATVLEEEISNISFDFIVEHNGRTQKLNLTITELEVQND